MSKFSRIGLAALILFSVAACGKKGDVKPPPSSTLKIGVSAPFLAVFIPFLAS